MTGRRRSGGTVVGDEEILRAAARTVGVQLAAVCALLVVIVSVLAFWLIGRHTDPGSVYAEPAGDDDALVRDGVIAAGLVGVVIAGVVGWLAARRAVRPLGRALQLQRQFVADAGHELRTPLTVLHTRAQLLHRRLPADSPQRPVVDQLLDDSRALGEIVDELLAGAGLRDENAPTEDFDAGPLLAEVVASMAVLADAAGVTLTATSGDPSRLHGSRAAVRRALVALTDNALAHTPTGGRVVLAATTAGDRVRLSVTDTGEGLPDGPAHALTARFARGGTASTVDGRRRFGLGLALVADVAHAHGGRLRLEAGDPAGVVATLELPAVR